MKVLLSCLLIMCSLCIVNAQEESSVKLFETENGMRGTASGPTMLQYRGHRLKELFGKLDPGYAYEIDHQTLRRKHFTLEVQGDLSDKQWIIEEINKLLKKEGYEVTRTRRHPRIFGLTYEAPQACDHSDGVASVESQTNNSWEGQCVTMDRVVEKLLEWHPNVLFQMPGEQKVANVNLEKSTFKDLQRQLADQGLKLEVLEALSLRSYITAYR